MFFISDITTTAQFRVGMSGLKQIRVNSYIRKGRTVRSCVRGISRNKKVIHNTAQTTVSKVDKPAKAFDYLSSGYNTRFNYAAKEELLSWNKTIQYIKPTKQQLVDYDDTRTIIDNITNEIKNSLISLGVLVLTTK
jgi:hypothetical protein